MITAVTIAGTPVDLGVVEADMVTVLHGRAAVGDGPTASSAELHLLIPDTTGLPAWSAGDALTITADTGPLFTGTITDRRIGGHIRDAAGQAAQLELIAAGPLATAGYRIVGDTPWPQEVGSARAARIIAAAGLTARIQTPTAAEPQVLARDVDAQPALTLLTQLAADTGAAVVDLPDGRILYQPLECRSRPIFNIRWMDIDEADTWATLDPAMAWQDLDVMSPASATPLDLPPDAVEAEPQWTSSAADIINRVHISYGPTPDGGEQPVVTGEDAASVARYGRRDLSGGTQLATLTDAQTVLTHYLSTRAWERWALGDITVWAAALPPQVAPQVATLTCGDWVQVTGLPQPAPATGWAGIVEGWAYRETREQDTHDAWWTLALSDPLHSLAVFTWADYLPTYTWAQHPPGVLWADLTTTSILGA